MRVPLIRSHAIAVLALFALMSGAACAGEVRVAVASNFAAPIERIAALFQQASGHKVNVSLGSSGKLYAQIVGGAPYDVFLAADDELPKRLMQEGQAVAGSRFVYALGKLVLWSAQPDFVDAKGRVLRYGNYDKLAIANPKLAPYGMAAKQTLEKLAMWNGMQRKLVKGENITQTYQFAVTENAELAFVAVSQVMQDGKIAKGSWWLVPDELHQPLRQSAVLLSGAKDLIAAQAFLDFLRSRKATEIIRSYGYELP